MKTAARCYAILAGILLFPSSGFAGFAGTEEYLAAVGNPEGAGGAHFFTTVWITDVSNSPVTFTFRFLRTGQANNGSPASFTDTVQPGQTKVYTDVVKNNLGLTNANGAARITANGELFVSERIFNQPAGTALAATAGQFFSGIPKAFSIRQGQTASLQGVYAGSGKDFRYNYVLLETSGANCNVHVRLLDAAGAQLGAGDFALLPYEHLLLSASTLAPSASSDNARLTATVTSGAGTALFAGSQVGNSAPQDQSGFEMSFPDEILSSGGGGVTSLNGLTGPVTLTAGSNITFGGSGNNIVINAAGGGGGGLTSVAHDATLTGDGTGATPLGVALPLNLHVDSGSLGSITNSGTGQGLFLQTAHAQQALLVTNGTGIGLSVAAGGTGIQTVGAPGILGEGQGGGLAAHFDNGNVRIEDDLHVVGQIFAGTKDFKIDHPLDPENKYLVHASIESSEMLNVYSGNATLGANGTAIVPLPEWMEAENGDFRYQLTAVGTPQPGLFVSRKIENHEFAIAGGVPGAEVSWQVTGVRQDLFAKTHPLVVEEAKPEIERGFYLHPEAFGQPKEKRVKEAPDAPRKPGD